MKKIFFIIMSLMIFLSISTIYAADNTTSIDSDLNDVFVGDEINMENINKEYGDSLFSDDLGDNWFDKYFNQNATDYTPDNTTDIRNKILNPDDAFNEIDFSNLYQNIILNGITINNEIPTTNIDSYSTIATNLAIQELISELYYNSAQYDYPTPIQNNDTINSDASSVEFDKEFMTILKEDMYRSRWKLCIDNPSIMQNSLTKVFGNTTPFTATFYDNNDKRIENTTITFKINGVSYYRLTNKYGQAKININLSPGNYTINSYNPVTKTNKTSKIIILPNMDQNKDIVKFYKNETQYTIRLLDCSGNPVADKTVTFNINGVFYEKVSNSTGYAKLNINLSPNTYIITAEYENCRVSNNITVLSVLKADDLYMNYLDGSQFNVKLVDGQGKAYPRVDVTFNINGVFYQRTTDNQGIAKLNIRLMPGEYIITSMFNGLSISNKIYISNAQESLTNTKS